MNVVDIHSAEEFLDYLRPSNSMWWDATRARHTHYFRGHANTNWPLLPKGLRPLGQQNPITPLYFAFFELISRVGVRLAEHVPYEERETWLVPYLSWRHALNEAVHEFSNLGRQVGLETPWFVQPSTYHDSGLQYWPSDQDEMLLALAQHHNIPTMLLDWSEDPLTAAYFAVGDQNDTDLCVWALPTDTWEYRVDDAVRILVSKPPTSGNTNIRAQNGVFVRYYGHQTEPSEVFDGKNWLPFERVPKFAQVLSKITLPAAERDELRRMLLAERRSAAHLMPSWDNVASTLLARWRLASF